MNFLASLHRRHQKDGLSPQCFVSGWTWSTWKTIIWKSKNRNPSSITTVYDTVPQHLLDNTYCQEKEVIWEKQNVSIESFRNSRTGNPLPLAERRSLSLEDGLRSKSLRRPRRGHTYGAPWAITRHRLIDCLDWRSSVDVTKSSFASCSRQTPKD